MLSFKIFVDDQDEVDVGRFYGALFAIRAWYAGRIQVVNLSIWMTQVSKTLLKEFEKCETAGIIFAICAGNQFVDPTPPDPWKEPIFSVTYPARLQKVLSVGAITLAGERADFSRFSAYRKSRTVEGNDPYSIFTQRNSLVDVVAPGIFIVSTVPQSVNQKGIEWMDGTSMATPYVTAAVAILRSKYSSSNDDIRGKLKASLDRAKIPAQSPSSDVTLAEMYGDGLLDYSKL